MTVVATNMRARLAEKLGIDEANLARRKEYVRLGEEDRALLVELRPWAQQVVPDMAREFYDWQFAFAPTAAFFQRFAEKKGIPLPTLRQALERTQAGYFVGIFEGAVEGWGVDWFENRLLVGFVHDRIDLPFKWYVGAYPMYWELVPRYLEQGRTIRAFVSGRPLRSSRS